MEAAGPPTGWTAHYGNLHSHSAASDGVDTAATAFTWAEQEGGLSFLSLSEHNHMVDVNEMDDVKSAADASTSASFVGIAGQEYSTISGGNHVNVHDVWEPIPAGLNKNYREFFRTWLPDFVQRNPNATVVCQFNHPANPDKDYGIASVGSIANYAGDWTAFRSDVDPWVSLIAIITGPADSDWPKNKPPLRDQHRDVNDSMRQIWFKYLDRGFHLSPVADQDNHRKTWGTRTTARTGVWLNEGLSRKALLTALKEGRTFASEDKNLRVWFTIDGEPMGSILPGTTDRDLSIQVTVEDDDEPGSTYVVRLSATSWVTARALFNSRKVRCSLPAKPGASSSSTAPKTTNSSSFTSTRRGVPTMRGRRPSGSILGHPPQVTTTTIPTRILAPRRWLCSLVARRARSITFRTAVRRIRSARGTSSNTPRHLKESDCIRDVRLTKRKLS